MSREQPDHTLQTTALVNEAYIRLIDQVHVTWQTVPISSESRRT